MLVWTRLMYDSWWLRKDNYRFQQTPLLFLFGERKLWLVGMGHILIAWWCRCPQYRWRWLSRNYYKYWGITLVLTPMWPMCILLSPRRYSLSKIESNYCCCAWSALVVSCHSRIHSLCVRSNYEIWWALLPARILEIEPELVDRMNGTPAKVLYELSCRVKPRRSCCNHPTLEYTEAEFVFNFLYVSLIIAYMSNPGYLSIDRYGNHSRIISIVVGIVVIGRSNGSWNVWSLCLRVVSSRGACRDQR